MLKAMPANAAGDFFNSSKVLHGAEDFRQEGLGLLLVCFLEKNGGIPRVFGWAYLIQNR